MRLADLHPVLTGTLQDGLMHADCPCGCDHVFAVRIGGDGWRFVRGEFPGTLTIEPSIRVSGTGGAVCWHGYLTDGEMKSC